MELYTNKILHRLVAYVRKIPKWPTSQTYTFILYIYQNSPGRHNKLRHCTCAIRTRPTQYVCMYIYY